MKTVATRVEVFATYQETCCCNGRMDVKVVQVSIVDGARFEDNIWAQVVDAEADEEEPTRNQWLSAVSLAEAFAERHGLKVHIMGDRR